MSNQSGSAFWTCAVCGGMGSALDSTCPSCGAARGTKAPAAMPTAPTTIPVVQTSSTPVAPAPTASSWQRWLTPTCRQCGAPNSLLNTTCATCGASLQVVAGATTPRNRVIAIVLALLGGIVGAQYFYMGRYAAGIACVALSWTGYSLALGFFEGLRMMTMTDAEFAQACRG